MALQNSAESTSGAFYRVLVPPARNPCATAHFSFNDIPNLTAALQTGNDQAFQCLHQQWNPRIYRYSFVLAYGDESLAIEIVQATYIKIFKHIRPLSDETALWNWIAKAARNAATDLGRTGGRYQRLLGRFKDWLLPVHTQKHPLDADANPETLLEILDHALVQLEKEELELLQARYFDGDSLEDIANRLGLTHRAVEGRLARLRKKLKAQIQILVSLQANE